MTQRQQQRRPRARTCATCGLRWIWPDAFPHPESAECNRCTEEDRP